MHLVSLLRIGMETPFGTIVCFGRRSGDSGGERFVVTDCEENRKPFHLGMEIRAWPAAVVEAALSGKQAVLP